MPTCADANADGTANDAHDCSGHTNDIADSPGDITCAANPCTDTECCTVTPSPSTTGGSSMPTCADANADGTANDAHDCSGHVNAIDGTPAGITCSADPCTDTECCTVPPPRTCADINADGTANDAHDCSGHAKDIAASPGDITCAANPCIDTECCTVIPRTCADTNADGAPDLFNCPHHGLEIIDDSSQECQDISSGGCNHIDCCKPRHCRKVYNDLCELIELPHSVLQNIPDDTNRACSRSLLVDISKSDHSTAESCEDLNNIGGVGDLIGHYKRIPDGSDIIITDLSDITCKFGEGIDSSFDPSAPTGCPHNVHSCLDEAMKNCYGQEQSCRIFMERIDTSDQTDYSQLIDINRSYQVPGSSDRYQMNSQIRNNSGNDYSSCLSNKECYNVIQCINDAGSSSSAYHFNPYQDIPQELSQRLNAANNIDNLAYKCVDAAPTDQNFYSAIDSIILDKGNYGAFQFKPCGFRGSLDECDAHSITDHNIGIFNIGGTTTCTWEDTSSNSEEISEDNIHQMLGDLSDSDNIICQRRSEQIKHGGLCVNTDDDRIGYNSGGAIYTNQNTCEDSGVYTWIPIDINGFPLNEDVYQKTDHISPPCCRGNGRAAQYTSQYSINCDDPRRQPKCRQNAEMVDTIMIGDEEVHKGYRLNRNDYFAYLLHKAHEDEMDPFNEYDTYLENRGISDTGLHQLPGELYNIMGDQDLNRKYALTSCADVIQGQDISHCLNENTRTTVCPPIECIQQSTCTGEADRALCGFNGTTCPAGCDHRSPSNILGVSYNYNIHEIDNYIYFNNDSNYQGTPSPQKLNDECISNNTDAKCIPADYSDYYNISKCYSINNNDQQQAITKDMCESQGNCIFCPGYVFDSAGNITYNDFQGTVDEKCGISETFNRERLNILDIFTDKCGSNEWGSSDGLLDERYNGCVEFGCGSPNTTGCELIENARCIDGSGSNVVEAAGAPPMTLVSCGEAGHTWQVKQCSDDSYRDYKDCIDGGGTWVYK